MIFQKHDKFLLGNSRSFSMELPYNSLCTYFSNLASATLQAYISKIRQDINMKISSHALNKIFKFKHYDLWPQRPSSTQNKFLCLTFLQHFTEKIEYDIRLRTNRFADLIDTKAIKV